MRMAGWWLKRCRSCRMRLVCGLSRCRRCSQVEGTGRAGGGWTRMGDWRMWMMRVLVWVKSRLLLPLLHPPLSCLAVGDGSCRLHPSVGRRRCLLCCGWVQLWLCLMERQSPQVYLSVQSSWTLDGWMDGLTVNEREKRWMRQDERRTRTAITSMTVCHC